MHRWASLLVMVLVGCATGEKIGSLRDGMSKNQVIATLGQPDGFRREGRTEALTYSNRLMSGWSWDRADYHVILTDGQVSAYGPGVVRQNSGPAVGTLFIVPIR
jgi:hypothetical protein